LAASELRNQLTPWNRVVLYRQPVAQLLKNFLTIYGIRMKYTRTSKFFTIIFTRSIFWLIWLIGNCGILFNLVLIHEYACPEFPLQQNPLHVYNCLLSLAVSFISVCLFTLIL
jgi:hypothetical protein